MTTQVAILLGLGVVACGLFASALRRAGFNAATALGVSLVAVLVGAAGARGLHILLHRGQPFLDSSGWALDGGIVGFLLPTFLLAGQTRTSRWRALDAATLPLALAIVVARIGCFITGCCFGKPTLGIFAMDPGVGSLAHRSQVALGQTPPFFEQMTIHPTQTYEIAASVFALAALSVTKSKPGVRLLLFVGVFEGLRSLIWMIRQPDRLAAFNPQFISIALAAVSIVLAIAVASKRPRR